VCVCVCVCVCVYRKEKLMQEDMHTYKDNPEKAETNRVTTGATAYLMT